MELRCDGIIFDFNGTLFFDTDKQEQAWNTVSFSLRGHPFDPEEMDEHVHGRNGKSIFEYLLGREIEVDAICDGENWSSRKSKFTVHFASKTM